MAVVAAHLRLQGIHVFLYLNQWLFAAPLEHLLCQARDYFIRLANSLGIAINLNKSSLAPVQILDFIGARLDTTQMRVYIHLIDGYITNPHNVESNGSRSHMCKFVIGKQRKTREDTWKSEDLTKVIRAAQVDAHKDEKVREKIHHSDKGSNFADSQERRHHDKERDGYKEKDRERHKSRERHRSKEMYRDRKAEEERTGAGGRERHKESFRERDRENEIEKTREKDGGKDHQKYWDQEKDRDKERKRDQEQEKNRHTEMDKELKRGNTRQWTQQAIYTLPVHSLMA
ncbi:RNA-binding protein 25-like [Protopterus annectens]|uniref:RNA-binding protein 25-like n=1 Tax=Protopterus annectens TaxID=7888 RepID=UPI001CFB580E|nr:RNA-binding protein 25-like [Protopterus annectens]